MTSEIVLMNRSAVAMAADSAVTISGRDYLKTYQSVDKLFPLVSGQPVGVMIYNNAEIMSTPWETVISLYREQARGRPLDTVDAYARDFTAFLCGNEQLFPASQQDAEFFKHVAVAYSLIAEDFDHQASQFEAARAGKLREHVSAIFEYVVAELRADYDRELDDSQRGDLACFPAGTADRLERRYGAQVSELAGALIQSIRQEHPGLAVSEKTLEDLRQVAVLSVTRDAFFEHYTGVVFAGFGARERFPSMRSLLCSTVVLGTAKHRQDRASDMTADGGPVFQPFAQDRMIKTFLTGMDPHLKMFLFGETLKLSSHVVTDLVGAAPLTDGQRAKLYQDYSEQNLAQALKAFFGAIDQYQFMAHTAPILRAIQTLPKKELGETAASLIKLNSFQQKVMHAVETVGGPISLATITRNEGLKTGKERADL